MKNTISSLWHLLHEAARHIDPNTDVYAQITKALDAGMDGDDIETLIEELESAANFMRGLQLDTAVPKHAKGALADRIKSIDELTERLTMGDPKQ